MYGSNMYLDISIGLITRCIYVYALHTVSRHIIKLPYLCI